MDKQGSLIYDMLRTPQQVQEDQYKKIREDALAQQALRDRNTAGQPARVSALAQGFSDLQARQQQALPRRNEQYGKALGGLLGLKNKELGERVSMAGMSPEAREAAETQKALQGININSAESVLAKAQELQAKGDTANATKLFEYARQLQAKNAELAEQQAKANTEYLKGESEKALAYKRISEAERTQRITPLEAQELRAKIETQGTMQAENLADVGLKEAQTRSADAQAGQRIAATDKIESQTAAINAKLPEQIRGLKLNNNKTLAETAYEVAKTESTYKGILESIRLTDSRISLNDAKIATQEVLNQKYNNAITLANKRDDREAVKSLQQVRESQKRIAKIENDINTKTDLTAEQIKKLKAEQALLESKNKERLNKIDPDLLEIGATEAQPIALQEVIGSKLMDVLDPSIQVKMGSIALNPLAGETVKEHRARISSELTYNVVNSTDDAKFYERYIDLDLDDILGKTDIYETRSLSKALAAKEEYLGKVKDGKIENVSLGSLQNFIKQQLEVKVPESMKENDAYVAAKSSWEDFNEFKEQNDLLFSLNLENVAGQGALGIFKNSAYFTTGAFAEYKTQKDILDAILNRGVLNNASDMKGALSDKDVAFLKSIGLNVNSTAKAIRVAFARLEAKKAAERLVYEDFIEAKKTTGADFDPEAFDFDAKVNEKLLYQGDPQGLTFQEQILMARGIEVNPKKGEYMIIGEGK